MSDESQQIYLPTTPEGMKASEDNAANWVREILEIYLASPSNFDLEQVVKAMRDYQRYWMCGRHR